MSGEYWSLTMTVCEEMTRTRLSRSVPSWSVLGSLTLKECKDLGVYKSSYSNNSLNVIGGSTSVWRVMRYSAVTVGAGTPAMVGE